VRVDGKAFHTYTKGRTRPAFFDARAFNVPKEDVPNYFVWRQRDWERNTVLMAAQHYLEQATCFKRKIPELRHMLEDTTFAWDRLANHERHGTFIFSEPPGHRLLSQEINYETVERWVP
jgi:hypothetical protein